jgi:hypothetical protein
LIRKAIPLVLPALLAVAALGGASTIDYMGDEGNIVAQTALTYIGVPYVLAGSDASGVDCSGLVCAVYATVTGARLPRTVDGLIARGEAIEGPFQAGDLLFFDTTGGPSHVGIALDARSFVHAASEGPQTGVIVSTLDERYYHDRFIGARRLIAPGAAGGWAGGRFVVRLDDKPVRARLAAPVAPGAPLAFALAGPVAPAGAQGARGAQGGAPAVLTLRAIRDGSEVMTRRVSVAPGAEAGVWMVATPGQWTVIVEGRDGGYAELQFQSGGRP